MENRESSESRDNLGMFESAVKSWLDAIDSWLEPEPPDFEAWYREVMSLGPNDIRPFLESAAPPFFEIAQTMLRQSGLVERLERDARLHESESGCFTYDGGYDYVDWRANLDK